MSTVYVGEPRPLYSMLWTIWVRSVTVGRAYSLAQVWMLQDLKSEAEAEARRGAYQDAVLSYTVMLQRLGTVSNTEKAHIHCCLAGCLMQTGQLKLVRLSGHPTPVLCSATAYSAGPCCSCRWQRCCLLVCNIGQHRSRSRSRSRSRHRASGFRGAAPIGDKKF